MDPHVVGLVMLPLKVKACRSYLCSLQGPQSSCIFQVQHAKGLLSFAGADDKAAADGKQCCTPHSLVRPVTQAYGLLGSEKTKHNDVRFPSAEPPSSPQWQEMQVGSWIPSFSAAPAVSSHVLWACSCCVRCQYFADIASSSIG